jgi:hypothetical protein
MKKSVTAIALTFILITMFTVPAFAKTVTVTAVEANNGWPDYSSVWGKDNFAFEIKNGKVIATSVYQTYKSLPFSIAGIYPKGIDLINKTNDYLEYRAGWEVKIVKIPIPLRSAWIKYRLYNNGTVKEISRSSTWFR